MSCSPFICCSLGFHLCHREIFHGRNYKGSSNCFPRLYRRPLSASCGEPARRECICPRSDIFRTADAPRCICFVSFPTLSRSAGDCCNHGRSGYSGCSSALCASHNTRRPPAWYSRDSGRVVSVFLALLVSSWYKKSHPQDCSHEWLALFFWRLYHIMCQPCDAINPVCQTVPTLFRDGKMLQRLFMDAVRRAYGHCHDPGCLLPGTAIQISTAENQLFPEIC